MLNHRSLTIASLFLALGAVAAACSSSPSSSSSNTTTTTAAKPSATTASHMVHYDVYGTAKASTISYSNLSDSGEGTTQVRDVPLPWIKTQMGTSAASVFNLVAQAGATSEYISCQITIDGNEVVTKVANGPHSKVDCKGSPRSSH